MSAAFSPPPELINALTLARHVVVFTGAGVSAESGIATFRDALTGLWNRFDVQDLATAEAFDRDPELVWGWYEWRRMQVLKSRPNPAHLAIARLARLVPRLTLVTQNVDDLHERAGSEDALHLHGSLHSPRCASCGQAYFLSEDLPEEPADGRRLSPPACRACGGLVRPGVVWFGECLPRKEFDLAFAAAQECDLLFSVGTSGLVQPAASIPLLARQAGARVAHVNPTLTGLEDESTWMLQGAAAVVMPALLQAAFS